MNPHQPTIFDKILDGEIPCHRVYEDEHVLAFLDIGPLSEGHTLVVPKEAAETLDKLPDETAAAVGRVLPRIAKAVLAATGATAFNILQNNGSAAHQAVMHVHFHIIPRYADRELGGSGGGGLNIKWGAGKLDQAKGKDLAARIAAHAKG